MKKLKIALPVFAALAFAMFAARWLLPAPSQVVERALVVAAPPSLVLEQLREARLWPEWMPRDRLDPAVHRNFGGPPAGVGASYYWSSNDDRVGQGRMTITAVSPTRFEVEREMTKPAASSVDLEFALAPDGAATRVSVSIVGNRDLAGKPMLRFTGAEGQLATELDEMLARLRDRAEAEAKILASRIQRSVRIAAPPEAVLAKLGDVHRWGDWSPWSGPDAKLGRTFGGTRRAVGSSCYWSGDGKAGRLTILSVREDKAGGQRRAQIEAELELRKPQLVESDLEISLAADGNGTRVTARATGPLSPADLENALVRVAGGADPMRAER
jgi:hypothetical protein